MTPGPIFATGDVVEVTAERFKPGTHVECKCAPGCASSWPPDHGPCVVGVVVDPPKTDWARAALAAGDILVAHDRGEFSFSVSIGYGQRVRQTYAATSWCAADRLRVVQAPRDPAAEMAIALLFARWVADSAYRQMMCGNGVHSYGHGEVCHECGIREEEDR